MGLAKDIIIGLNSLTLLVIKVRVLTELKNYVTCSKLKMTNYVHIVWF